MSRLTYIGRIEDGKLQLSKPRRAEMLSDIVRYEGRQMEIELRPLPRRSNPQNAYYWGCVIPEVRKALKDLGHEIDADLTHELLKSKFNKMTICDKEGEVLGEIGDTTTKMNKVQFMEYLDKIIDFAAQYLNITIPLPNEQATMNF